APRPEGGASPVTRASRPGLVRAVLLALLVAVAAAFPQVFTNPAVTNYGVLALIFVTVASAWNIFSGNSGYISLGHAVFFGSGAYAAGLLAQHHSLVGGADFATLPFGGLVGAAIAVPFGLIALPARRPTLVVITIAVLFTFQP